MDEERKGSGFWDLGRGENRNNGQLRTKESTSRTRPLIPKPLSQGVEGEKPISSRQDSKGISVEKDTEDVNC